jgi:hypothetical protein
LNVQGEKSSNVDLATDHSGVVASAVLFVIVANSLKLTNQDAPMGLDGRDLRCRHNRTHARESGEAKNASAKTGAKTKSRSFSDRLEKQTMKQHVSSYQR